MRPSSLGGGRILRRTLSVRLSVCPSVPLLLPSVTSFRQPLASRMYFSARTEGRISYGHLDVQILVWFVVSLYVPVFRMCLIMKDRSFNRGFPSSVRCSIYHCQLRCYLHHIDILLINTWMEWKGSAIYATATWLACWVSVTRRYCIKMVKPILKLFRPSGSPIILVSSDFCADTHF